MQTFSKVSAQTSYGQFRQRWLHGSLSRQAYPAMSSSITQRKQKEALDVESDLHAMDNESAHVISNNSLEFTDLRENHINALSISVSLPSPSTPMSDRPCSSDNFMATANSLLPPGPFVSPVFSPLTPTPRTPTMTPRTPSKRSIAYRVQTSGQPAKASNRLRLELDFSPYPNSPRFPASTTIPSPFRMQLQEDVATTPLPSTPLTARWLGSGVQGSVLRSNVDLLEAELDGAAIRKLALSNMASKPSTPSVQRS